MCFKIIEIEKYKIISFWFISIYRSYYKKFNDKRVWEIKIINDVYNEINVNSINRRIILECQINSILKS